MKSLVIAIAAAVTVGVVSASADTGQVQSRPTFAGRSLAEALRELQRQGLGIVFSSEIVRTGMRVDAEPVGRGPRQILDALLKPHGLDVREGPGSTLIVVRSTDRAIRTRPPTPSAVIRGVVVDASTATPLEGVVVRVVESKEKESITDPNGAFEIVALRPGRHIVFASLIGYALARPEVDVVSGGVADVTIALSAGTATYTEQVKVIADPFRASEGAVPSATVLGGADLLELRGVLSDDPFRALQALPAVTFVNDLRSEFSVRGNDYRHIGLTIDGMTTDWPVHSVYDDAGGGSVALLNSDVVDQVTLFGGSYPQDRPARTGAWADFSVREGSRERLQVRGALSMTSASLILEGPVGRESRGSWLVAGRQSYVQWILRRLKANDTTAFGFTDIQAKAVYDRSPTQRLDATLVAGRSLLDLRRDDDDPNLVSRGDASALLLTAGWRATHGPTLVTAHRIAASRHSFANARRDGEPLADGVGHAIAYRGLVTWMTRPSTMMRAGIYLQRDDANHELTRFIEQWTPAATVVRPQEVKGSHVLTSADIRVTEKSANGIVLDAGALISKATHDATSAQPSPWGAVIVPIGKRWFARTAGGVYRQHPGLDQTLGTFAGAGLRAERAHHVEAAIEHRWTANLRVQLTGFARHERDMLLLMDNDYRVVSGRPVTPSLSPRWANVLDGTSTGAEVMAQRRASNGLNGWIAYTYSHTRYVNRRTGETFVGDFDQRHTFTAYGQRRLSPATSASAKLRLGSNIPIPGYLDTRHTADGDVLFVGERRNAVRLPGYVRFDVRANHAFNFDTRRLTLFVEIVNVTGHGNYAPGYGSMRVLANGRVTSTRQRLFPFLPTAGILVEF